MQNQNVIIIKNLIFNIYKNYYYLSKMSSSSSSSSISNYYPPIEERISEALCSNLKHWDYIRNIAIKEQFTSENIDYIFLETHPEWNEYDDEISSSASQHMSEIFHIWIMKNYIVSTIKMLHE
jgi:hypothetical protein